MSLDQTLEMTWSFQFDVGGSQASAAPTHRSEDATSSSFPPYEDKLNRVPFF